MLNMLKSLICLIAAEPCSVVSHGQTLSALTTSFAFIFLKNIFMAVWNFILSMIWAIEKFVLGIMDALQTIVYQFLGIGTTVDDYLNFANNNEMTKTLVTTFRAILVVSIVLMIIFTIIAIIRQEVEVATNAKNKSSEESNKKGPIVMKLFKGIMSAILLPFAMIAIIGAVNSVLTAFNNALQGENQTTIAGQVLATSTYDTNKYRQYANNNKRVPIIINAYNVDDYGADEKEKLFYKIKSLSVQKKLINTATDIDKNLLLAFNDSLIYENNKLSNSSAYADYYENFVCTAEQYQVMADFIDYCELTNTNFYIKAIDDNDIEWKYVDSTIFDAKNMALNITYRDANDLDGDGKTNDTYTVSFSMGFDVTSPISNALKSISALLGLNEFGDMTFNEMDRDKNSINLVQWANEKVSLHFSYGFNINDMKTWTPADEILMYEYYHYASNNTLAEFDFSDLSYENRGNVTLDAYKIVYRDYYPEAGAFSKEKVIYCVYINGSYYKIKKSEKETDSYGNKYYVLDENDDVRFLEKGYTILSEETEKAMLKFVGKNNNFSLNNPSSWSYTDQILIYEFYKDLSYNNTLSEYNISDLGKGIEVPTYLIRDYDADGNETSKRFVYLNGTYYAVSSPSSGSHYVLTGSTSGTNFLESIDDKYLTTYYNFSGENGAIKLEDPKNEFGISTNSTTNKTPNDFIIDSDDGLIFTNLENGINYVFDKDVDFKLSFSAGFDFRDVDTWSYKDYFLFYLYAKYLNNSSATIDSLKYTPLPGLIGEYNGKYYYKIQSTLTENNTKFKTVYLSIDDIDNISLQNIKNVINVEITLENNRFSTNDELAFTQVSNPSTIFSKTETETKVFTFSSDVSFENVNLWKMRDYILFLLESRGIISITSNFEDFSYNSVCYKGVNIGTNLTTNLYSFGSENNRIYLNEKYLLGLGYNSLDEFLDTNLITFIAKKLSTSSNGEIKKLLLEKDEVISSIANSDAYSGNTHMLSSLAAMLVNLYGLKINSAENIFEIYSDITKYSYSNPSFVADNLSTYTVLDLAIYFLTGSAVGSYEGYVANVNGDLKYIIGNYAISITSGSLFESTIVQRGSLTSGLINLGSMSLSEYYTSMGLDSKVTTISDSEISFRRADNINYIYVNDITNGNYSALDSILAGLGLAQQTAYNIYTNGTSNFVFLGSKNGKSYFIETNSFNLDNTAMLTKETTITLNSTTKPFTQNGTYTANFNGTTTSGFSFMDAAIYELTNDTSIKSFNVYTSALLGGKSYIFVNGNFIEYNNVAINFGSLAAGYDDYTNLIDILVNNYYGSYVVGNIGTTTNSKEFSYSFADFDVEDISSYTPIRLMLHRLGLTEGAEKQVSGTLTKSADGSRTYFVIKITDENGKEQTYNINVTELLTEAGQEKTDKINELYYRAALCYGQTTGGFIAPSEAIENLTNLNTSIENAISSYVVSSYTTNILNFTDTMSEEDISTWNWLDIIHYSIYASYRNTDSFVLYSGVNYSGDKEGLYVGLSFGGTTRFVKFSESLLSENGTIKLQKFSAGVESVEFSLDTNSSLIDLLYYKYTGLQRGNVNYVTIGSGEDARKIYSIQDQTTGEYIYYAGYADPDKESSINSVVSEHEYSYLVKATTQNLQTWNLLDLLIKAAEGNTSDRQYQFSSRIYTIDSKKYILVNGYYINLDLVGARLSEKLADGSTTEYVRTIETTLVPTAESFVGYSARLISNVNISSAFNYGFIKLSANNVSKENKPLVTDPETGNVISSNEVKLYFSEGFSFSDYSTWKNSDFMLYYLFKTNHMDANIKSFQHYVNLGYVPATLYNLETYDEFGNLTVNKVYKVGEGECNFGSFANLNSSTVEAYKATGKFSEFIRAISEYKFINANIWQIQYQRELNNISVSANTNADLIVSITDKPITDPGIGSFGYSVTNEINAKDFLFENYYYFNLNSDNEEIKNLFVDTSITDKFDENTDTEIINFKLSSGFNIEDVSTWTILDYIIVREYARDHSASSIFANCSFEELREDFLMKVYVLKSVDGNSKYLKINGQYYNITNALGGETGKLTGAVSSADVVGDDYSYSFRVNAGEMLFNLSRSKEEISRELVSGNNSLVYNLKVADKTYTYYRKVDKNLERVYRVSLTDLDTYTISVMVLEVNWVQKLMNDMQVLYPDLNWSNLIATNGWLDTLGDYHSSYASGQFISSGNTANITAAGMVLSEFLLTIAETSYDGFADYEYSSVFDEDVIDSLMLAMLGEKAYQNVKTQAKVFVEMFNVGFAKILDDVADERGLNIKDGEVSNLTMSVYKSYLASILLSSDLGEYLYTVATRVYAQYAIYESLAFASGDYSSYFAYINGLADENGDTINAFKYASFRELIQFENTSLKDDAVPVYTFNYYAVYKSLANKNATKAEANLSLNMGKFDALVAWVAQVGGMNEMGAKVWLTSRGYKENYTEDQVSSIANHFSVDAPTSYKSVLAALKSSYKSKYMGYRGSTERFDDNDETRFSYMLHVYYSIRQDLNNRMMITLPTYVRIYEDYIDGNIDRWGIECDISIDASSNYIQNYDLYKILLLTNKMSYIGSYILAFFPDIVVTIENDEDLEDFVEDFKVGKYSVDANSLVYRLKSIFPKSTTYGKILNSVFATDSLSVSDIIKKFELYSNSEDGSASSWNTILKTRDNIEALLGELSEVMDLEVGEKTPNGSVHVNFTHEVYNQIYNSLSGLSEKLNDYIGTQNILDKIEKGSITFTLAQFSSNYVESGFEFTIKNKVYKLDTAISTQRLAEYVYGGAYLTQFGIYPQYTSSSFTGIIHPTKAVDPNDGTVKTKLNCFTELRTFAGNVADYTAKLYFLTNLKDLSNNVSDSVLLTEELYTSSGYIGSFFGNTGSSYKTSLEYLILDHIVAEEELSPETMLRLLFGDTEDSLNRMGCTDVYITLLAKYLSRSKTFTAEEISYISLNPNLIKIAENGAISSLSEDFMRAGLRRYLVYIQTTDSTIKTISPETGYTYLTGSDIEGYYGLYMPNGYNSHGYYSDGTNTSSERTHKAFKNVMSYLTISDEQAEGDIDLGIEGKYESFDGMTFKDFKAYLTKSLVDYEQNESETGAENASRYLTLFNLISGQFNYHISDGANGTKFIGTTLSVINKDKEEGSNVVGYKDEVIYQGNDYGTKSVLYANFNIDRSTRGTILKLCGIENRPIEELVNLEYDELYERNGSYDEADGDVFIVCSYDEDTGKYVPFLASNRKYSGTFNGTNYMDYLNDYGYRIFTDYYDSEEGTRFAYPIIAKGIVTPDLKPTAIKIQDNVAKFYRTDITATGAVEDTALQTINASVETTTVGYVKYVNVSSFNHIQAEGESKTMFIGSSDVMSFIKSDASVYYVQYTNVYNLAKADGFDAISVLDSFSAFFNMSVQMHIMMLLGFITLVPLLFKASGAVLKRILDLIFLVLAGPLCISMNSLKHTDEEQQAYSSWKKYMFSTLLSVFGLIISFNLYFIMVSTAMNMTFVQAGDSTMQKLSMIGGLGFVTAPVLNAFLRIIFVVIATNMIETTADMLLNMITGGKASSSLGSPLAGGRNAIDSIVDLKNNMVGDIKKVTHGARDIISGKILIEAKNAIIDSLPGSQIVRGAAETVGSAKNYLKSRELYKKARQKGVGKLAAHAAAKEFRNNYKKQRKQIKDRRTGYTQSFYGRMGLK